ncbi:MAG TPA: glycoside hydrolase family 2 TIM barrel-domain containing protein [Anaerolineae bacterium]|nr:glycoside hydrolase family 2 TIM barrel-domain containing protein [Anaerolineae bacterium]
MKNTYNPMYVFIIILFTCLLWFPAPSAANRIVMDLSNNEWGLFRDFDANWVEDNIYLPPVNISEIPVNPPTCGWDALKDHIEKTTCLPATIEEFFWGDNGNTEGVAGDWRGVSWWVTTVTVPADTRGKLVFLDFESVHLRAEIFVNRILTGYDVIGHTPFTVDITRAVRTGEKNEIAVRITDPLGNFNWNDRIVMKWGMYDVPACHGFGGITGKVFLKVVDHVYIDDIYVKNKSSIKEIDLLLTMKNLTEASVSGTFFVRVYQREKPEDILWEKRFKRRVNSSESEITFTVITNQAKVWDLEHPVIYSAEISFVSDDQKFRDTMTRHFGFRWFDIGEKNGDQRFYLNGKRIVLRGGMSWGFWPVNGVYPTREMAQRDVVIAKELGLTYMNFHRAIGQPLLMDVSDEMGFFTYEESGGYSCENADKNTTLWRDWRREKLFRMVKRDRSHPSLIIYNLQNRTPNDLEEDDLKNMKTVHEMDPSRIITFISGFWERDIPREHPTRLFFKPYDFHEYYSGWFDLHNGTGAQGYTDSFYNGPRDYLRYTDNTKEIVFWGEDGGLYSPPRLQLIKEYHEAEGGLYGWQGQRFIEWYKACDEFLDRSGFREWFPDVDALTVSMGNTTLYYHGRIIENVRIGNTADCYTINGWAAPHLVNQAEIVDLYRNPCGDPDILASYCRPLYIAVKLRDKVVPSGSTVVGDFFLINESDLKGFHTLTITLEHESGRKVFEKTFNVDIKGGEEFGQLLVEDVHIKLDENPGYFTVKASLRDRKGNVKAEGNDEVFSVEIGNLNFSSNGAVVDTSGVVNRVLEKTWGFTLPQLSSTMTDPDYIIIGLHAFRNVNNISHIVECVANGSTAVVLAQTDRFAEFLTSDQIQAADYRGRYAIGKGNFIAGKHELLDGLPQVQAFNWEYQIFYIPSRQDMYALKLYGGDTLVAAISNNSKEVGTALSVIPFGRGRFILSTLNILPFLYSSTPQSVVARRLFENCLKYASTLHKNILTK